VNKQGSRDSNGRWLTGTTGNAAGRGMTNRQRISEKLLADLATLWETHGESILSVWRYLRSQHDRQTTNWLDKRREFHEGESGLIEKQNTK
jgi:hypothetical protein